MRWSTDETSPNTAPSEAAASGVTREEITLTWQAPVLNADKVTGFQVSYRRLSIPAGLEWTRVNVTAFTLGYSIAQLRPSTLYQVRISSVYVDRLSRPAILEVLTKEDAPEAPPRNMTAFANSSRSAMVHWLPPSPYYANGEIVRYDVAVLDGRANTTANFSVPGSALSAVVGPLLPNRRYSVSVAAATASGTGPMSAAAPVMTFEDAPSASPPGFNTTFVSTTR